MKKALLCLILAATCGMASASSIAWALAGSSFSTSDGAKTKAGNYYVTVFFYSDYSSVMSAIGNLSTTATTDDIKAVTDFVKSSGTTKATGATSGSFTASDALYPSVTPVDLFMVAWDSTAIGSAANYLVSGSVKSDAYSLPDNPTNMGDFSSASFSGKTWTAIPAVPEPATGALALAGIALLLKRRKAAKA